MAHDDHGVYRGLYEWDGAERADSYARALWWVLALVSVRGSIDYRVLPGLRRADVTAEPYLQDPKPHVEATGWWRPVAVT